MRVVAPCLAASVVMATRVAQVRDEPRPRELGHLLERTRFGEQVRCPGHDRQPLAACELSQRALVHVDDRGVTPPDHEQRGSRDRVQVARGEVRPPSPRNDRCDLVAESGGGTQRGRGTGARTEVADR